MDVVEVERDVAELMHRPYARTHQNRETVVKPLDLHSFLPQIQLDGGNSHLTTTTQRLFVLLMCSLR